MKAQVTHLNLDAHHRQLLAMRSGQIGATFSEYVAALIFRDAEQSGLLAFLDRQQREAVQRGK